MLINIVQDELGIASHFYTTNEPLEHIHTYIIKLHAAYHESKGGLLYNFSYMSYQWTHFCTTLVT